MNSIYVDIKKSELDYFIQAFESISPVNANYEPSIHPHDNNMYSIRINGCTNMEAFNLGCKFMSLVGREMKDFSRVVEKGVKHKIMTNSWLKYYYLFIAAFVLVIILFIALSFSSTLNQYQELINTKILQDSTLESVK